MSHVPDTFNELVDEMKRRGIVPPAEVVEVFEVGIGEFFTFTYDDGERAGQTDVFDVTRLRAAIRKAKLTPNAIIPLKDWAEQQAVTGKAGIDEQAAMNANDREGEWPIVVVDTVGPNDDRHFVIDGNHRLYRKWRNGETEAEVIIIPGDVARMCLAPPEIARAVLANAGIAFV